MSGWSRRLKHRRLDASVALSPPSRLASMHGPFHLNTRKHTPARPVSYSAYLPACYVPSDASRPAEGRVWTDARSRGPQRAARSPRPSQPRPKLTFTFPSLLLLPSIPISDPRPTLKNSRTMASLSYLPKLNTAIPLLSLAGLWYNYSCVALRLWRMKREGNVRSPSRPRLTSDS